MKQIDFICSLTLEQRDHFDNFRNSILRLSKKITDKDIDLWSIRQEFIELIYDSD